MALQAEDLTAKIEVQSDGRGGVVIVGNTYLLRDKLKRMGARWDGRIRGWKMKDRAAAEALVEQFQSGGAGMQDVPRAETPVMAGRTHYKGRICYLAGRTIWGRSGLEDRVKRIETSDGKRTLLYTQDGKRSFWVDSTQLGPTRFYERPRSVDALQSFAEYRRIRLQQEHQKYGVVYDK